MWPRSALVLNVNYDKFQLLVMSVKLHISDFFNHMSALNPGHDVLRNLVVKFFRNNFVREIYKPIT